MKARRKNDFNSTKFSSTGTKAYNVNSVQKCSVLPLFPAALRPARSNKINSNVSITDAILQNAEDIIMTPCNTIIMQTTIDGQIQVSRTQKEREKNPDRLSLDRRGLTKFPILIGEAKLRLLSLQHNLLSKLERMALICLPHLVFLDIYNNQLETMVALDCLHHLRVLLLGKNRIKSIEGLSNMNRLEVLDLHGNRINQVASLKSQRDLKVLNLASNEIKIINNRDLEGLCTLQELNLRRNQIKKLVGFDETPQLLKLFLSNNNINSIEDLSGVRKLQQLKELTLDGNPVLSSEDCIFFLVSYIPSIQIFGQTKITEDTRKVANVWRLRKEFNEKSDYSFDTDKIEICSDDLKRVCSASGNRFKQITRNKLKTECGNSKKTFTRSGCSSTKPPATFTKTAKAKRASYTKRKTISVDSCYGSETSVEYFRLPPILTSSLSFMEDCGVVLRNDPNTSMESNKSYCSVRDEAASSSDESEESCTSDEESTSETNVPPVETQNLNDIVPVMCDTTTVINVGKEVSKKINTAARKKSSTTKDMKTKFKTAKPVERTKEQGGDFLVQISGRYLIVTGRSSARYIDKPWNTEKAKDVTTIRFSCVSFNTLVPVFNRIKYRFPNVKRLVFCECDFNYIGQLNSLTDVGGLTSLEVKPERNAIVGKNWRSYAIFRLHHWGLQVINNIQITESELRQAKEEYHGLSEMVLWSLPESLLAPLLSKLRLEVNSNSAKQWLYKVDPALRSVICKEALKWRPPATLSQGEQNAREKGRESLTLALETACSMVLKLGKLETEWPSILYELVENTLKDFSDMETYTSKQISELKPP